MGVYNPNADMPVSCAVCDTRGGSNCFLSKLLSYHDALRHRHPDCPLVEVPTPHGRLIDADEFLKDVNCGIWNWGKINGVSAITALTRIMDDFHYVPTVIEAEGTDED